jgi:uncharacterized membrane-anchored protein
MNRTICFLAALLLSVLLTPALRAQDSKPPAGVVVGPGTGKLGSVSQIEVPAEFTFLDSKATQAMMKKRGEPVSGDELGFLRHPSGEWVVFFQFSDVGYVKDDDKDKLTAKADELLDSYKKGTAEDIKRRKAAGEPTINIIGWLQEPKYDTATHNLTWAIRATSAGEEFLNYNTRLLGRKGVMEVILVCDSAQLQKILPEFNQLLTKHQFSAGESYAEYKQGDKIAAYGLAALVAGGAAVGAVKLGLFAGLLAFLKKGWKLVILGVAAIGVAIKKVIDKITGNRARE